jgi:hypothetical protein
MVTKNAPLRPFRLYAKMADAPADQYGHADYIANYATTTGARKAIKKYPPGIYVVVDTRPGHTGVIVINHTHSILIPAMPEPVGPFDIFLVDDNGDLRSLDTVLTIEEIMLAVVERKHTYIFKVIDNIGNHFDIHPTEHRLIPWEEYPK